MTKSIFFLLLLFSFISPKSQAAKLEDYLEKKDIFKTVRDTIANQDIKFGTDIGGIEILKGINFSTRYNYDVQDSYINKYYTRIDKWDVKAGVNIGDALKDIIDVPFSFSINRSNSFLFVRQFPTELEAIKAIPFAPNKLPLNSRLAIKNLEIGEFVSMPANLNVAVGLNASTTIDTPVVLEAKAGMRLVLSGEFDIQIFRLDQTHVRLKLITKEGRSAGADASVGASFKFFGIKLLDKQVDRLFDRDFAQLGYTYNPGAQFIIDYVFDLSNPAAQVAYDQILSTTFKLKDLIVATNFDARELKDKLISSYEKADDLFSEDLKLEPKNRRVHRVFKGFNNHSGHTNHLKLGLIFTSYTKNRTYTESNLTFVDKNEKELTFFYPTYSKYIETHLGNRQIYDIKDLSYQNNFGLIPHLKTDDSKTTEPDLGFTFERKDTTFTSNEQTVIHKFILSQAPDVFTKKIDLSEWNNGEKKHGSNIFFQLVLKSQGFQYLKNLSVEELQQKILIYAKKNKDDMEANDSVDGLTAHKFFDFLLLNRYLEKELLLKMAKSLAEILQNTNNNSKEMVKKLVALNEVGSFDKIGVGFLISLLPEDKIQDLVYLKINLQAKDANPVSAELGTLNYPALYKELTEIQSRLSSRSYDLRLSDSDRNMGDLDIENP